MEDYEDQIMFQAIYKILIIIFYTSNFIIVYIVWRTLILKKNNT